LFSYPNINDWAHVSDGKMCPLPYSKDEENYGLSFGSKKKQDEQRLYAKKFKIPLFLRTIGSNIEDGSFKLLPLGVFKGGLKIVITLNPNAFFVPYPDFTIFELDKLINGAKKNDEYVSEEIDNYFRLVAKDLTPRKYTLDTLSLSTEQYKFDSTTVNALMSRVRNGEYIHEYLDLITLDTLYMKNWPTLNYQKNIELAKITKLMVTISSDLAQHSPFSPYLERYNRGFKSIVYKQNGAEYPSLEKRENNSTYTFGEHNCNFFYSELFKGMATRNLPSAEIFLNSSNFAVNLSFQNILSLCYMGFLFTREEFKHKISNFEMTPYQINEFPNLFKDLYSSEYLNSYNDFLTRISKEIGVKKNNNNANDINLTIDQIVLLHKYSKLYEITLNPVASKTIYSLHFEQTPNSYNQFKEGINTVHACPFYVEMNRIDKYYSKDKFQLLELKNLYFHLNMYFECHASFFMDAEGEFKRI